MAKKSNFKSLYFYNALLALLFLAVAPASGQNLITNGDFEAGNTGFSTEYHYYTSPEYVLTQAGVYHVKRNPHDFHNQFFDMHDHTGNNGRFFMANGYGLNSSKKVWYKTVTVQPNTYYSFSFWATHISNGNGETSRARFYVKINGTQVGSGNFVPTFQSGGLWVQSPVYRWNSGTNTQATIAIYDGCLVNSGMGDDFGLDDIEFIPDVTYGVNAINDDDILACQNVAVDINVLANDIVTPNANDAFVSMVTPPTHGNYSLINNNTAIRYTFTGGNSTTDQFKYRVTNHGVTDDAWVYINTSRTPSVANITAPGPICTGGALGISTPTVNPSATGHWEYGSSQNGTFQTFDPNNIPVSMNGKWVRYSATNDCGTGSSNAVQITVTNGPTFSGQTPQIPAICDGQSLNLSAPAYNNNGSQILGSGWVVSPTQDGEYTSFNLNNINASYNGWYIRYMMEGSCGFVYSSPARQLVVGVAPDITGTLETPPAICAGDNLIVTVPDYEGDGTGAWEICQTSSGTYQSFNIQNVPFSYNNWYLRYKVSNSCGNDVSNAVQITVADTPTFSGQTPQIQSVCEGGSLNLTPPAFSANGPQILDQGWVASPTQTGNYTPIDLNDIPLSYNGWYICYMVEGNCGTAYSTPARQLVVIATIDVTGALQAPDAICSGEDLAVTVPSYSGNGTGGWEACQTQNGTYQPFDIHNVSTSYNNWYLRYKVSNSCGSDVSNAVQIHVYDVPVLSSISAPASICAGGSFSLTEPNIQDNGATITNQGWQIQINGSWQTLNNNNIPYEYNGHPIRYFATNSCGTVTSNVVQVTVVNGPSFSGQTPQVQPICAGGSLNLTPPTFSANGSQILSQGWVASPMELGEYTAINLNNISGSYNGWYLCYMVEGSCGSIYSSPARQLVVGTAPDITGTLETPSAICAGDDLTVTVPGYEGDGTGTWEICQTQSGTYQSFSIQNVPFSYNNWYLRYKVSNNCGNDVSNAVQITVSDTPAFSGQTPQLQPVCEGDNLNITPPTYSSNGPQILHEGWVASPTPTGDYTPIDLNSISLSNNGWYICYMVEGSCGTAYSTPVRQLEVIAVPEVTGALQAPDAVCAGSDLEVAIPSFNGEGTGEWEACQTQDGSYQPFDIHNVSMDYNNWYIRYKVSNECDLDVSNAVQIHVNDAPGVAAVAAPAAICAGNSFSLVTPVIQNNGATIMDQGWQIQVNGSWQALNNNNIPYEYNGCQIRYFAENSCGVTYGTSMAVTVNDEPLVGEITAPVGICAGESFNLTTPQVIWRHANQGTGRWEIQINGQWQTLNNNNVPLSYNGCNIRYKAINDCGMAYSPNNVQLTVYSTDPVDEGEITACDVIYHHGTLCNHNGNYSVDSITPNGCTVRVSWHFTLGEAYYAPVQYQESCDSYYWSKTHRTYYESNVYDTLIISNNPQVCDSTFTLDLTINHAPSILNDVQVPSTICAGNPLAVITPQVEMNHIGGGTQRWEYATSANGHFTEFDPLTSNLEFGTYYLRFVAVNECGEAVSNVVPFHVDAIPVANMQLSSMQVCEGQILDLPDVDVTWNNENENDRVAQWQMSSSPNGTFTAISPTLPMQLSYDGNWLRFMAHNSCGEYIVGPVLITVMAETEEWLEAIQACDSYTLESGSVVAESQVIDYEYYDPCFRVVHQPIEISHSDHVTESITSCHESLVWNGMTFYHSDQTQYSTVTLSNQAQCDSVVELHLDFGDFSSYTYDKTACESYVWDMNPDHVYTESVRDSVFVAAVDEDDCDTWYFLNLTVGHEVIVDGGEMTECSGFVWHGVPYYADAVLYDSLLTVGTRCDSIVTYQLHVIAPVATDTSIMACNPIWWQEHFCEEEGDYQHTFQSIYGCDSIVTVHFSLSEQLQTDIDTLSCEPFRWYEHYCNTDGMTYSHLFHTSQGCDSTVLLHVSLSGAVVTTLDVMACNSYEYNGVVYDEPGEVYIDLEALLTQAGCDSIVQLRVEIKDSESIGWIHGSPSVFVASNLVSGIYQYEMDTEGVEGDVSWSLTNSEWRILEAANGHCRILVTTPGSALLKASFYAEDCGEMERVFEINAGYYDVDEQESQEVNVYPNPTKGTLTVEAEGIESIRLIDVLGQVLETRDCDRKDSVILNLHNYMPSVYLLEIKTHNGVAMKRVTLYR